MTADPGPESSVTGDDERRAEIEALLGKIADRAKYLSEPAWNLEGCAIVGAEIHRLATEALDRVRDARGNDEACPACGHEWRRHDPEDGRCDAHSAEPGVFGPCRCGRDAAFTAAANARLSRAALAARSPQDEDHEAGIEAALAVWPRHSFIADGKDPSEVNPSQRARREALLRPLIAAYLARVSPARDGTVAVEDVARWLQHIDRLDEIPGAKVGLPRFNPLWDAAEAIRARFGAGEQTDHGDNQ